MGIDLLGLPPWLRPRRKMTRQVALALGYDPQRDGAPEVLAKGRGAVAERIIELARENGVFIHQDADLAETLALLDEGAEIPQELYAAVAEVIGFIYRMNARFSESKRS